MRLCGTIAALAGILAFRSAPMRLSRNGETERVAGALVSGTYFRVLGVEPSLGTVIADSDDVTPGSGGSRGPVVVLSHSFWLRRFGGQPSAIGSGILLNGNTFTVAGIAPPGFQGTEVGEPVDVFAPMTMQESLLPGLGKALSQPRSQWLRIFGRLGPGANPRQVEAELTTLLRHYNEENFGLAGLRDSARRQALREQRVVLLPAGTGLSQLRSQYAESLWILSGVVAIVLLIACANVADLLLSRAVARRREIAIRLSLGAGRARLVRQLLIESLLLSAAGSACGLILARWMRDTLTGYLSPAQTLNAALEPGILLFTLLLGTGAALLFGLVPALQATRVDVAPAIKGEELKPKSTPLTLRKGLVVFQMSLSCLLLIATALFLRSLHNLLSLDPGFAREKILVASVESGPGLETRLLNAIRTLPGVTSVALADAPPLGTHTGWNVYIPGYTPTASEPKDSPSVGFVSSGYFATMRIPLLLGRDFDERDSFSNRDVMVVNETFARHFFAGANPIGQRLGTKEGEYPWEIIGVVKDSKYTGLREGPTRMIYAPLRPGPWASRSVVHLRFAGDPASLASALRQRVKELDPASAIFQIHTVQEELDRSLSRERLLGTITALFGGLALALAAIGLYGLMSYGVTRRTREFGIRIALGARTSAIIRHVVSEAFWLMCAGTLIGLAVAWILRQVVAAMLFGIQPADPLSALLAVAVLAGTAFVAAWLPARRAAKVDPVRALRWE
ncbi:MAG: ABC transporter permease [Paludibaculum sp.]